jgi:hypothetical protein
MRAYKSADELRVFVVDVGNLFRTEQARFSEICNWSGHGNFQFLIFNLLFNFHWINFQL